MRARLRLAILAPALLGAAVARPARGQDPFMLTVRGTATAACDPAQLRAFTDLQLRQRAPGTLARAGAPRGYLGLQLSELSATAWSPAGRVVHYCAYPLVVSVEPDSPAARGGLEAGDTVVAYGSRDLVRGGPVALDRLLVPGSVLRVRVRRGGRVLTRAVTVGRAPLPQIVALREPGVGPAVAPFAPMTGPAAIGELARAFAPPSGLAPVRVGLGTSARASREPRLRRELAEARAALAAEGADDGAIVIIDGVRVRATTSPGAPGDPARPLVDYLRALPALPATAWSSAAPAALAGAQLVALDDELREVLARGDAVDADAGPVRGVFVLKVLPGPAAEAGLRAGDVVTAADGRAVTTPAGLQRVLAGRALAEPGGAARRAVALRVWRAGVTREVALRW